MDDLYPPGLLSTLGINPEDLRRQQQQAGLLSAGLQLLAGSGYSPVRRTTGELLGQAGMAGVQGMQQAGESAIQRNIQGLQVGDIARRQKEAELIRTLGPQLFTTQDGKQIINQDIANRLMTSPAGMEYLKSATETRRNLMGKTEVVEIFSPTGQPMKVRYNVDTGEYTPLGGTKAEPFKEIDLGDRVELRTPTGTLIGRINKGVAPTAPSFSLNEQSGLVINTRTGAVDIPRDSQGNPVDVSQFKPPTTEAQKQITGVQNTRNAIQEFRNELANFSRLDLLKPKDRARIESKYQNMLLQAKEAYNLGVLNGPDLAILEGIIYNPTKLKGAVIGKEGIDAQASELDRIMANIKTTVQTRGAPPAAPQPKANEVPTPSGQSKAPAGVAQDLWNVMTPEERKLWQR